LTAPIIALAQSRLSCQVPLTKSLDGLRVAIAPAD
jgi:hypothetical protein